MRADVRQFFVRFNVSSHQIVEGGPGRNVAGAVREYFQSDVDHLLVSAPGGLAVLKSNYLAYTPGEAALLYHSQGGVHLKWVDSHPAARCRSLAAPA